MTRRVSVGWALLLVTIALAAPSRAVASVPPAPVATYLFQSTLAAQQAGAPALVKVDPLGASGFEDSVVFGQVRRVFRFDGTASPPDQQAGLTLDTTGLIAPDTYSVEMVVQFLERDGAWRRIVDVQGRQSDCGFYVDPSNRLDVFCAGGGGPTVFTTGVYHHVVLTNGGGGVRGYLDGTLQFTVSTGVMNVANPSNAMNFFLDNVVAGGQGEFSDGRVALIRLYSSVLVDSDVAALAAAPFSPAAGALVFDLKTDWSDTNNPNGVWTYAQGVTPLPHLDNWPIGETVLQPAWAHAPPPTFGHIPSWLQVKQTLGPNMQAGDVVVHTPDPFNASDPNTPATAVWTSPSSGTVVVSGNVWYAGDAITDRPQDWALVVNGVTVASGVLVHGAAHTTRADPTTFSFAGEVSAGEKISVSLKRDPSSAPGWIVGTNLTITLTPGTSLPSATSYFGFNPNDQGVLRIVGWTDGTDFALVSLPDGRVVTGGTLNRFATTAVSLAGIRHFVLETSAPMQATFGFDCCNFGGSFYYPRLDGRSAVGREFIVQIPVLSDANELVFFAYEPSVVTVHDATGALTTSFSLAANTSAGFVGSPFGTSAVYHVESTGNIAIQSNARNAYTAVPSSTGSQVGTEFLTATRSWGPSAIAVFAYEASTVTARDLATGNVAFMRTIPAGQFAYVSGFGDQKFRITSTGRVGVWAGSTEGGDSIESLGDNLTITTGDAGRDILFDTQTQGGFLFALNDQTTVTVDGVPSVLNRGQFIDFGAFEFHHVLADKPVIVETIGGNGLNDWATMLVADTALQVPNAVDLSATIAASRNPATVGSPLTYTLTAANRGRIAATSVVATVTPPASVSVTSSHGPSGSCLVSGGTVTCALGTVNGGTTASATITVVPTAHGMLVVSVSVAGNEPDFFVGDNTVSVSTTVVGPPAAPTGLAATVVGANQVALAWSDNSDNETGFQIERRTVAGFARIAMVAANVRTFTDTRAAPNTVYRYRVRAVNSIGVSAYTNEAAASLQLGKLVVRQRAIALNGPVGGARTAQLEVRNAGRGPLTGSVGSLAAPFAVTGGSGSFSLAPGGTVTVIVRFSPTARGTFTDMLTITSQTPGTAPINVAVTGTAR